MQPFISARLAQETIITTFYGQIYFLFEREGKGVDFGVYLSGGGVYTSGNSQELYNRGRERGLFCV